MDKFDSSSDRRKSYWDSNYLEYWQSKVEEARISCCDSSSNEITTEDDSIYRQIFAFTPFNLGNLLDVGCAWGRMFDLYSKSPNDIFGVDISSRMISSALERYPSCKSNLFVSPAEQLPFSDSFFRNIVCIATFDALYQELALAEFCRVLSPGGLLYISGKNTNYHLDDENALAAEIGARKKGHPNYFTDVLAMKDLLVSQGYSIVAQYYFSFRGDFASLTYSSTPPDLFYEYLLVIQAPSTINSLPSIQFSSAFSNTFNSISTQSE